MPRGKRMNSFFDELRVVQRHPIIELKSIYGLSNKRDVWSGDVTSDGAEFVLVAAANGGTQARLETAERGPYPPGQEVEPGMAVRLPSPPSGGQGVRFGYFDDLDGWFYQFDADGLHLGVRRAGVDVVVSWGIWAGDVIRKVEGPGYDEFRPGDGYVYQIPFTWYGFGPAMFNFQLASPRGGDWIKTLDTRRPIGETSIAQPHLPIRCEVYTEAGDAAYDVRVSGRQVSVVGDYDPIFRETSIERQNVTVGAAAWVPLVAARRRAVYPHALTELLDINVIASAAVRIAIVEDAPVAGASWEPVTDYDAAETLLEQSLAPGTSLLTEGNLLRKMLIPGGGQGNSANSGDARRVSRMPMLGTRPFVIYARQQEGAGDGTVSIVATFREDY